VNKPVTKVSGLRLKEMQEEPRTLETLNNIPLRSLLFNGGVMHHELYELKLYNKYFTHKDDERRELFY